MNTNGNIYTVIYTTIVVVVVAAVLAFASEALKPIQDANVKADAISQMLTAAHFYDRSELENMSNDEIIAAYKSNIKESVIVNAEGKTVGNLDVDKAEIYTTSQLKAQDSYAKKKNRDKLELPVFVFNKDGQNITVIPCYGAGLWGAIWGYIALDGDLKTIIGAYFDHASETPGLGAKIKDDPNFRAEFEGKQIDYNDDPAFEVVKGGADPDDVNAVDAITGASITSKKLGESMDSWFKAYKAYLTSSAPKAVENVPVAADSLSIVCDSLAVAAEPTVK